MVDRCKCSCCSLEAITKPEECICSKEVDRVSELMGQLDLEDRRVLPRIPVSRIHLNRWVLEVVSLNLKTKSGTSYRVLPAKEAGMKQSKVLIFIAGDFRFKVCFL